MNSVKFLLISLAFFSLNFCEAGPCIDVVIPCVKGDLEILPFCIKGIRKNVKAANRIIIISKEKLTDDAEWVPESNFPFSKEDVAMHLTTDEDSRRKLLDKGGRAGWYLQQLLKLYAPFVIDGISENVLIVDADTVFLNPVTFLGNDGLGLYDFGNEKHPPYFDHMQRLLPALKKVDPKKSGIVHHMLFQKKYLKELFEKVEARHHLPFWKAFCSQVAPQDLFFSGASEYEIYFNFMLSKKGSRMIRPLKHLNVSSIKNLEKYKKEGYHYVSCHYYLRD
ncbi:DUF6492 family protein [Criblamydia sequanensis]|uniref:Conserved putative secreted protein n=1 Tax=Candidatus Criblamydia sequanensis CRIB-18 TaxID=1437425 RepID=A0A090CZD0_9BACT|nr:DUF6492 family protein [Criblamydia sequanensis]CDR34372.1 Conserved putative secreted protein [Criblamydia sequanensis CRIB-18]